MNPIEVLHSAIEAHQSGDFQKAEDLYREVLHIEPEHFYALHYLGVLYCQRGNYDIAIELIQKALQVNPSDAHAHYNLGIALQGKGRADEAIAAYRKALSLAPGNADAFVNLGVIYKGKERLDDALDCFRSALAINPSLFAAHNNLGIILRQKGEIDDAVESFSKASELRTDSSETLFSLASALMEQGKTREASEGFERVLSHRPDSFMARFAHCMAQIPIIHSDEVSLRHSREKYQDELMKLRDTELLDNPQRIEEASRAVGTMQPFYLAYQGFNDRELQKIYGDLVCSIMKLRYPQFAERPPMPVRKKGEALRIGFVSGYFHNHSIWKIPTKGWIENLDRDRFKVHGYYTWTRKDSETATARKLFSRFVEDVYPFEDLCGIIRNDNLHILVFPEIGMDPVTLKLASLRLAPIQCVVWGHPETSGLPTIDYFLSSALMEPSDADTHYTEKLVRLPNLSAYYDPPELHTAKLNREQFGLQLDAVLYHCCQAPYKYLPQYDEVFPRIALEVKNCKFLFGSHPRSAWITELFRKRIKQAFERFDLNPEEFAVFLPFLDIEDYNALYYLSDVFLDPIGWSGCNSALEAVSCDLPVVSLPTDLMRGRDGYAILTMADMKNAIASSLEEYIGIAAKLGKDAEWRSHASNKIAKNKNRIYRDRTCIDALEEFFESVL